MGEGIAAKDRAGRTALHYAAADGKVEEVRTLINEGADPSEPDQAGFTPLHFAAQQQHADVIGILAEVGANVDARDRSGNTPLFRAVSDSRGQGEAIQALLAADADPDAVNNHGFSPRVLANRIANYDVAQFIPDAK